MNYMYLELMPSNKVLRLTRGGMDRLTRRLEILTAGRHKAYGRIHSAVKETQNDDSHATNDKINDIERNDKELHNILQVLTHATVVVKEETPELIDIGSIAVLHDDQAETHEYMVVCPLEVDLENHKISNESPFGQQLLGKKTGDAFHITNRNGNRVNYTIIDIK